MEITMPSKDYLFLRQYMPTLSRYVRAIVYQREKVVITIADSSLNDFLLDYRSSYVRYGITGENVNPVGQRLNVIYRDCIMPLLA